MSWENRRWSFVKMEHSGSVDFSTVIQTSFETTRKSLDNTEFMIKWDGSEPGQIGIMRAENKLALYTVVGETVNSGSGPHIFNHADTLAILATPRWSSNDVI